MRIGINHKRNRYKLPLFVFIIIITAAYIFIRRLEPMFITQLTCHANTIVTDRVNKAIYNAFDDGYSPHEMQTSEDGGVTSLSVNMQIITISSPRSHIRLIFLAFRLSIYAMYRLWRQEMHL